MEKDVSALLDPPRDGFAVANMTRQPVWGQARTMFYSQAISLPLQWSTTVVARFSGAASSNRVRALGCCRSTKDVVADP